MKILYAIQGTGNGHVCRACDIVPLLMKRADVDVLVSGTQADIQLPFDVKYVMNGLGFVFGRTGGVDLLETYRKSRLKQFLKEVRSLRVDQYDLVISDFEPVSSWACFVKNKPCVALSHQAAVLHKSFPQPKHIDPVGRAILKVYAPASVSYGFHFEAHEPFISTPVIRSEIRTAAVSNNGHYTVYLPAYSDRRIIRVLSQFPDVQWQVFSKHFSEPANCENIMLSPINNADFIRSMASSAGVLCGAGFETPAEALFLGKKLLVIPMRNQYEQHCNAETLSRMGVPVIKSLKEKHAEKIRDWLQSESRIDVDYPDETALILERIMASHAQAGSHSATLKTKHLTVKNFRKQTLKKVLHKMSN